MKQLIPLTLIFLTFLSGPSASAQWVVTDPGNLAQAILQVKEAVKQTKIAVQLRDAVDKRREDYKNFQQLRNSIRRDAARTRRMVDQVRRTVHSRDAIGVHISDADWRAVWEVGEDGRFDGEYRDYVMNVNARLGATIESNFKYTQKLVRVQDSLAAEVIRLESELINANSAEAAADIQIHIAALQARQMTVANQLKGAEQELTAILEYKQVSDLQKQMEVSARYRQNSRNLEDAIQPRPRKRPWRKEGNNN